MKNTTFNVTDCTTCKHVHVHVYTCICICYNTLRVLYQIYNHRARGRGDYKSDIARVGML